METAPHYPWMDLSALPVEARQGELEERRGELLREAETEGGLTESLQHEWCQLLLERDRVLKLKLKQENEQMLRDQLLTLLQVLVTIGQFDHSSTPGTLKLALYNLYTQLSSHIEADLNRKQSTVPPPPPTPPPIHPALTLSPPTPPTPPTIHPAVTPSKPTPAPLKRLRLDDSSTEEHPGSLRRKQPPTSPLATPTSQTIRPRSKIRSRKTPGLKHSTPGGKYTHGGKYTPKSKHFTPRGAESEDLRRCLLTGKEKLKSTPGVKRSPGGTPQKSRLPVFSDNPSDIVTLALRRKFYNVRRLYGSPGQEKEEEDEADSRENSFNLSID